MKKKLFLTMLVVMVMSTLIAQRALATDELSQYTGPQVAAEGSELDELLASIEADRSAAVDDLVNSFASDEASAGQLRATLDSANASKIAEIIQNANSLEDVTAILAGAEGILALGDLDKDYVFTPVTPCRIIDTRFGGGGVFFPGQFDEYYVYGPAGDIAPQGGNAAGCPSPRGEPRGVHINVTAVPQSGQGNFAVYPADVGAPNASFTNYRAGIQNVANAGTVKTFLSIGPKEIEFLNSFGTAHLVVDVLGYYHETENLAGADFAASSNTEVNVTVPQTVKSVSITAPAAGKVIVNASGYFRFLTAGLDGGRCSISSGSSTAIDFAYLIIGDEDANALEGLPFAGTRGFNVGSGITTFRLNCDSFQGTVNIGDATITAIWVPRTY